MFVALDIATACGVSKWSRAMPAPIFETWKLVGSSEDMGPPMWKMMTKLSAIHEEDPIEILFIELGILPKKTTQATLQKLYGLIGAADLWAFRKKVPSRSVEQQKWRKHFIGVGSNVHPRLIRGTKTLNPKWIDLKKLAQDRCAALGWEAKNDNEADAGGQLDYGLACFGIKVPWRDANLFGGALAR